MSTAFTASRAQFARRELGCQHGGAPSGAGAAGSAASASAFGPASFFGDAAASDGDSLEPGSAHARDRSGDFDGEWDKNNTDLLGSLGLD